MKNKQAKISILQISILILGFFAFIIFASDFGVSNPSVSAVAIEFGVSNPSVLSSSNFWANVWSGTGKLAGKTITKEVTWNALDTGLGTAWEFLGGNGFKNSLTRAGIYITIVHIGVTIMESLGWINERTANYLRNRILWTGVIDMGMNFVSNAFFQSASLGWAGVVGWLSWVTFVIATWPVQEKTTVTYNCMTWQPPTGGEDCELCNDDYFPCTEYRCKSLGSTCQLVNKGTSEELCVHVPVSPEPPFITPNDVVLSSDYQYDEISDYEGFKIKSTTSEDGCLPAYKPLKYGVVTDEVSKCKVSIYPEKDLSDMFYMGGSSISKYNHTDKLFLPGAVDIQNTSSIELNPGNEMTLYVKCIDEGGNENEADYLIRFCLDPRPDIKAPEFYGTSIKSGSCVANEVYSTNVYFHINEPVTGCSWSYDDKSYELMEFPMRCHYSGSTDYYTDCIANLSAINEKGTNYYIRCNDTKGNMNSESYEFSLRGSPELKMDYIIPENGEILFSRLNPLVTNITVQTSFGCNDGRAYCSYSGSESGTYIPFLETNTTDGIHIQKFPLGDGENTVYIQCVDEGGNLIKNSTTFDVDIDLDSPAVARIYKEESQLKLVTPYTSECSYSTESCDFNFDEATTFSSRDSINHFVEWERSKTYYVKCKEEGLVAPTDCSTIIRPTL